MSAAALAELAKIDAAAAALRGLLSQPVADPAGPVPDVAHGLANPSAFFAYVRARPPLGPTLSQAEVDGCTRILGACAAARFPVAWGAYVLATAVHETAGQLRPIAEYGKGAAGPMASRGATAGRSPMAVATCN